MIESATQSVNPASSSEVSVDFSPPQTPNYPFNQHTITVDVSAEEMPDAEGLSNCWVNMLRTSGAQSWPPSRDPPTLL